MQRDLLKHKLYLSRRLVDVLPGAVEVVAEAGGAVEVVAEVGGAVEVATEAGEAWHTTPTRTKGSRRINKNSWFY